MVTSSPAKRYQDILEHIGMARRILAQGGGLEAVLAARDVEFHALRSCLAIVSEAAVKLGELAEVDEPDLPWRAIRGMGNFLRHEYDDLNTGAVIKTVQSFDDMTAACQRQIARHGGAAPGA